MPAEIDAVDRQLTQMQIEIVFMQGEDSQEISELAGSHTML